MNHVLGLMAKYWQPGQVKTRLGGAIGNERAADFHRASVECLCERFATQGEKRWVVFSPRERATEFSRLVGSAWQIEPQSEGNLGARMRSFFTTRGSESAVVLIGADSPNLPADRLKHAWTLLRSHRVVLGPCHDGGYYLLGIAGPPPAIFEGIAWSTPAVLRETCDRLDRAAIPYALLDAWYDVDELADLQRLQHDLDQTGSDEPLKRLAKCLAHDLS